ncbi:MAG: hypothetical protein KBC17_01970 [Candidatus Pacebacteria bacterium]|nr:hypothetical protein [Candidatus Paceibacterota bacterium]
MKKRFFAIIPVLNAEDMNKVLVYLNDVHKKEVMHTAHFEKVLIFPTDGEPEITVIMVAKSVEHADQYEKDDRAEIGGHYVRDLVDTGLVGPAKKWTSTTEE